MKISVCMATYNGEQYIKEQLESILPQLGDNDEVIISDDSSTDGTLDVVNSFNDDRIKIYKNQTFASPIYNFENAIKHANGDIIVLSDQDDIWGYNKIKVIKKNILQHNNTILQMYNGDCINDEGTIVNKDLFDFLDIKKGLINNIIKNSFIGCNVAFSKELLKYILPFPKNIPMHDMWIGSCAYMFGKVEFIDEKILSYRLHDNNFTGGPTSVIKKINWRYQLISNLIKRYIDVKLSN